MKDVEIPGREKPRSEVLPWVVTVAVYLMFLVIAVVVFATT